MAEHHRLPREGGRVPEQGAGWLIIFQAGVGRGRRWAAPFAWGGLHSYTFTLKWRSDLAFCLWVHHFARTKQQGAVMILLSSTWPNTENSIRYKLFAELVIELVHPSSWDSYKCHTLSTPTKIQEIIYTGRKVLNRSIPKPTIQLVVDEANQSIKNDPVLSRIMQKKNLVDVDFQISYSDSIEKILARSQLFIEVFQKQYQKECEQTIKDICLNLGSKSTLITVTKLYISYLVNIGFSKAYILSCAKEEFDSSDIRRCTVSILQRFFDNFNKSGERTYTIYICGRDSSIERISDLFALKAYDNQADMPGFPVTGIPASFGTGPRKKIVSFPRIKDSDPFSAARRVEMILGIIKSFHYLHPTQGNAKVDNVVFAVDDKKRTSTQIDLTNLFQPHQYLRSRSTAPVEVKGLRDYVFQRGKDGDKSGQSRVYSSLKSLALASNSTDSESRLVTLWSAFEALLPEPSKEDGKGVRITHFAPLILPCACYDYLWSNFKECYEDCSKQFGVGFTAALALGSETDGAKGLAKIMLSEKPKKQAILKLVASSPLMLNRLGKLHDLVNEPTKLLKYWKLHESRVEWQIHRIYRERNDLVHKGTSSPFLEGLVENAYAYYRSVFLGLEAVNNRFSVSNPTRSLELIGEMYKQKFRKISDMNQKKDIQLEEKRTKILDIIFNDRLS
jgi:hypothetical protein